MTNICNACVARVNPSNRTNLTLKQTVRRTRCSCCAHLYFSMWSFNSRRPPRGNARIRIQQIQQIPQAYQSVSTPHQVTPAANIYTYTLEEDCAICYDRDHVGNRQCLQCNGNCCSSCWSRVDKCPLCRCDK